MRVLEKYGGGDLALFADKWDDAEEAMNLEFGESSMRFILASM